MTHATNPETIEFEGYLQDNHWSLYKFNFNGSPTPILNEVNGLKNKFFRSSLIDHFILYGIADHNQVDLKWPVETIEKPSIIANFSTTNSAHSICEMISLANYFKEFGAGRQIIIPDICMTKLKYVSELLIAIVGIENVKILEPNTIYLLKDAIIRRNIHFVFLQTWDTIDFERENNTLIFENLEDTVNHYNEDLSSIRKVVAELYETGKNKYNTYDKIMLAKLSSDKNMTTPGRAILLSDSLRKEIEDAGIKIISVSEFSCLEEYVTVLYGAKVFVTSYGGAACTNRFFLNKEAEVILIGNNHYAWEYEYPSDGGDQWHLRHSHLFPVKKQTVLLYHNDEITSEDTENLIKMCDTPLVF